ncbi:MAG: EAL domain-containing protein [Burkholderiaceae bacterium]|nr:EAL domain-containing protein [Burkholderiaceae bacterium]
MYLCNQVSQQNASVGEELAAIVEVMSGQAAQRQESDISKLKRMEEELAAHALAFRSLAENLPDNIARWDTQGRYLYINSVHERTLGVLASEVLGKPIPDTHENVKLAIARVIATGQAVELTRQSVLVEGELQIHEVKLVPERDAEDCIVSVLGLGRNMTEAYRMREAIETQAQEFRSLAESSPDLVIRADRDLRVRYLNTNMVKFLGLGSEEEVVGRRSIDIWPDGRFNAIDSLRQRVVRTGDRESVEVTVPMADGKMAHHQIVCVPERNAAGEIIGTITFGRDITAIRETEHRLSRLVEHLPGVAYSLRLSPGGAMSFTYVSAGVEEMYGVTPEAAMGDFAVMHGMVHPDDKGRMEAAFAESARTMTPFRVEVRICPAGQPQRWLGVRSDPQAQPDGSILWHGILLDITERKGYEERLHITASVFEVAHEGVVIADPQGYILEVNPAFSTITGYTKEEAQGKRCNLLSSGLHDASFYQDMWSSLRTKGEWSGELTNRRKDGELYQEYLNIVGVYDPSASLKHYVGVFSDISELKRHAQRLEHIAHHDVLTGLPNRLLLTDRLSQAIAQARRAGRLLAILYLDLDGFKPINDNWGHAAGDNVLRECAQRLSSNIRMGDTVARLGGDEFVILLTGLTDTDECDLAVRRLLDAVAEPIALDSSYLNLSASIGVSLFPTDGSDDADILLRYADQAMYLAKAAGRNQCIYFGADADHKASDDKQMVHNLRLALQRNELSVHYQPIIDPATGLICKAEALVRWKHPEQGFIPPSVFIPIAERAGLIQPIGDFVFREAARVAAICNKQIDRQPGDPIRISINRSPRQFFHRDGISTWRRFLAEHEIPGELLTIEITEGLLLDDSKDVLSQLNQLRSLGMNISLDDFGTGYSALSYLKKFDIDYLKIDRSFIRDISSDPDARAIVEAIIVMAKRLGIKTIAEGVETRDQLDVLAAVDCDLIQGYYYSRPLPEFEFLAFVANFHESRATPRMMKET